MDPSGHCARCSKENGMISKLSSSIHNDSRLIRAAEKMGKNERYEILAKANIANEQTVINI